MNCHLPQAEEARAEMYGLMSVPQQMHNAQNNRPIIGIVQDALVGSWKITDEDVFFTRQQAHQLFMALDEPLKSLPPPAILKAPSVKPANEEVIEQSKPCWGSKRN